MSRHHIHDNASYTPVVEGKSLDEVFAAVAETCVWCGRLIIAKRRLSILMEGMDEVQSGRLSFYGTSILPRIATCSAQCTIPMSSFFYFCEYLVNTSEHPNVEYTYL